MNYHWNWGIFLEQVKSGDETYLDWLFTGLGWTLAVSLTAWAIALAIGIGVGALRTTPSRLLVMIGNAWVELFRNVPLLVQMFLWFFVVPEFLPRGQRDASLALGFTLPQAYRHVILPQPPRIVIPPRTSEFMNVFKNSSVAFAIGVLELTFQARQMQEDSEQGIETYLAVTLLYFICAFSANRGMAWIEARTRVRASIQAMPRLALKAQMKYSSVTAR